MMVKIQSAIPLLLTKILLLLCIPFSGLSAQHCQYDFKNLVSVIPFSGDSQNVVKGLTIQLVFHTKDVPITLDQVEDLNYHPQPIINSNEFPGYFERITLQQGSEFEFTLNHYAAVYHNRQSWPKTYYLLVKDVDGNGNGGDFGTRIMEFDRGNSPKALTMHLCGYNKNAESQWMSYEPIFVDLNQNWVKSGELNECGTQIESWSVHYNTWQIDQRRDFCGYSNYTYATELETDSNSTSNRIICVKEQTCTHAFPHSERIDCVISELKNGKWIETQRIQGCE